MAREPARLSEHKGPLVITPHPGELAHLLGSPVEAIQKDRIKAAQDTARMAQAIVVLKGAGTIIANPGGECWVNPTGNPGLASGGSGDVLTGLIGGLCAQGTNDLSAAKLGVYLHGYIADQLVAANTGVPLIRVSDLVKNISKAIRSLDNEYYRVTEEADN
jgi:NAD(P)H-hydrate epimerase